MSKKETAAEAERKLLESVDLADRSIARKANKLSKQAFELIMDSGGVTVNERLFKLAVHGIQSEDSLASDGHEVVQTYRNILNFARESVNSALAKVVLRFDSPNYTFISDMMYVPPANDKVNPQPDVKYRLRDDLARNRPGGWIELGVEKHRAYDYQGGVGRKKSDFVILGYAQGDYGSGRIDDYTGSFDVGFQAIYDKRPGDVRMREPHDIFVAIIDSAIEEYPRNIR